MFKSIQILILSWALIIVNKKKYESSKLDIEEGAQDLDYYLLFITHPLTKGVMARVDSYDSKSKILTIKVLNESNKYDTEQQVPLDGIKIQKLVHRYHEVEFIYSSLLGFFIGGMTFFDILKAKFWYRLKKKITYLFPLKSFSLEGQAQLLQHLINEKAHYDSSVKGFLHESYKFSIFDILLDLYGMGRYGHPQKDIRQAEIQIVLDSLESSEDIIRNDGSIYYSIAPKAFMTLSAY